uniref:Retrotransposon Copia-like N-terminal domain-containing protein n=1 Tax=Phaseolus vulgaris TaxID=3885 RepID=V7BJA2_PHAVU|nr:hypothetical protein PHAVU_006G012100g [Phaseolus vulgaris]ESW18089.1 hypothetical protein PHAVU_006G012100g [Phaseolus vulgaris]
MASASQSFETSITEKLVDSNYLHWGKHVELINKLHKLLQFIVRFASLLVCCTLDHVNPEHEAWAIQDQTLLVWFQSTLSKIILSRVIGSNYSYEVWEKIHEYFGLQTKFQE